MNPGVRFAEICQVDMDYPGMRDQRVALAEALTPDHGSDWHRVMQRLDRAVNATGRSYINIGFHFGMEHGGLASPAGINLSAVMDPKSVYEVAQHEICHLWDFWLLTEDDRQWFMREMGRQTWPGARESFAEAGREWLHGGWAALDRILLPD